MGSGTNFKQLGLAIANPLSTTGQGPGGEFFRDFQMNLSRHLGTSGPKGTAGKEARKDSKAAERELLNKPRFSPLEASMLDS